MMRLLLVFAVGAGLVACNDTANNETGTGGSIDSNYAAPVPPAPKDHTAVKPDTAIIDSSNTRKDNPDGTSSGESGAATNSNNSGSAKDDTKGNK